MLTPPPQASLAAIESSLLVVCLDGATHNTSDTARSWQEMFRQMLTGAGARFNGGNRWYDKATDFNIDFSC